MIDLSTPTEENNNISMEICDEATLRSHAIRLNPSIYGSSSIPNGSTTVAQNGSIASGNGSLSSISSSSANNSNSQLSGVTTTKKASQLIAIDEVKTSPRKSNYNLAENTPSLSPVASDSSKITATTSLSTSVATSATTREKRKSPCKKSTKASPVSLIPTIPNGSYNMQVPETSSALNCSKRLKYMIEEDTKSHETNTWHTPTTMVKLKEVNSEQEEKKDMAEIMNICTDANGSKLKEKGDGLKTKPKKFMSNDVKVVRKIVEVEELKKENENETTSSINATDSGPMVIEKSSITNKKESLTWTRDEDKIILIELKMGSHKKGILYERLREKLPQRTHDEIKERYNFLIDVLVKFHSKEKN